MQRDVNPMFNALLEVDSVSAENRLHFQIRDTGLIKIDRLGSLLGPRIIANASLPVGPNYEGFLELSPEEQIPGNGPPLLEVKVRFSPVPTVDVGLNTGVLVDASGSGVPEPRPSQALQFDTLPSALAAEALGDSSCGSGVPVSGAASGGAGVPVSDAEASSSGAIVPAYCMGGSAVPVSRVPVNTSSVFYIDPDVFGLVPPNQILAKLFDMQERRLVHPFPPTAGRNYNALGAGFDLATKRHASLWPGVVEPLPIDLDDVIQQMTKFNGMDTHPHWSSGVEVCLSWLRAVKDSMHSALQSTIDRLDGHSHIVVLRPCTHPITLNSKPRTANRPCQP